MRAAVTLAVIACCLASCLSINAKDAKVTHTVALSIEIDGQIQTEKIVIGLFGKDVPKTVENFRKICIGTEVNG